MIENRKVSAKEWADANRSGYLKTEKLSNAGKDFVLLEVHIPKGTTPRRIPLGWISRAIGSDRKVSRPERNSVAKESAK
jgi:hypothetical protein